MGGKSHLFFLLNIVCVLLFFNKFHLSFIFSANSVSSVFCFFFSRKSTVFCDFFIFLFLLFFTKSDLTFKFCFQNIACLLFFSVKHWLFFAIFSLNIELLFFRLNIECLFSPEIIILFLSKFQCFGSMMYWEIGLSNLYLETLKHALELSWNRFF